MLLITGLTGLSFLETGALFNRNRTTVSYGRKTIIGFFNNNMGIHNDIINVCHKLRLDEETINKLLSYENNRKNTNNQRGKN